MAVDNAVLDGGLERLELAESVLGNCVGLKIRLSSSHSTAVVSGWIKENDSSLEIFGSHRNF